MAQSAEAYAAVATLAPPQRVQELFRRCWDDAFEAGRRDGKAELISYAVDTDKRVAQLVAASTAGNKHIT